MANDLINQPSDEAFIKTQKNRVQRVSELVNSWAWEWSGQPREDPEAARLFPRTLHFCLFHLAIPELYPSTNKLIT